MPTPDTSTWITPYSRPNLPDFYTLSQTKLPENHTLHSSTYPYSPYMGVSPLAPLDSYSCMQAVLSLPSWTWQLSCTVIIMAACTCIHAHWRQDMITCWHLATKSLNTLYGHRNTSYQSRESHLCNRTHQLDCWAIMDIPFSDRKLFTLRFIIMYSKQSTKRCNRNFKKPSCHM